MVGNSRRKTCIPIQKLKPILASSRTLHIWTQVKAVAYRSILEISSGEDDVDAVAHRQSIRCVSTPA
jgi:hypothetical protein